MQYVILTNNNNMLLKNFSINRVLLNAKNLLLPHYFNKNLSQDRKLNKLSKSKIRLTYEQYKKKFKQCPKSPYEQLYCKKLFSKPLSKRETTTASDDYIKARKSLELHAKEMTKYIENESRLIENDLKNRLEISKTGRATQLKEFFQKTTQNLNELMKLDISYGSWMRKETLLLNDEMKRAFDALERSVIPHVKCINSMLKTLQNDMCNCVERADQIIASCRKYDTPSKLADCVREKFDVAMKMIDQTNQEARDQLGEISRFREEIIKMHERTAEEVVKINREKATELSDYLARCIAKLKKC